MHLVKCKLPRRHTHKGLVNKWIVILFLDPTLPDEARHPCHLSDNRAAPLMPTTLPDPARQIGSSSTSGSGGATALQRPRCAARDRRERPENPLQGQGWHKPLGTAGEPALPPRAGRGSSRRPGGGPACQRQARNTEVAAGPRPLRSPSRAMAAAAGQRHESRRPHPRKSAAGRHRAGRGATTGGATEGAERDGTCGWGAGLVYEAGDVRVVLEALGDVAAHARLGLQHLRRRDGGGAEEHE